MRWRKPASEITDRAKRYRSRTPECEPPSPRRCFACGAQARDVHHLNGDESDGTLYNLAWACRPCNVRIANVMRRAGIGRLTRQYNPARKGAQTLNEWLTAVMSMKGESDAMTVPAAVELIRATPPDRRSEFASEIWSRRRQRGTDKGPPF